MTQPMENSKSSSSCRVNRKSNQKPPPESGTASD
ncbi:uncharacterized protein G2W53_018387 [Senna tora]|uniref:Uncharacterized protein n=1 Tax=Senna tora TaxID=362788 RepID=A0A834WNA7_9FABA|nr:uncharacterized protein G2W53_018387 [Senna tora]